MHRILASIDLSEPNADDAVREALSVAGAFGAEITLVSVVDRKRFSRGFRNAWPPSATNHTWDIDVHRVVLPGPPAEAITTYADHIRADIVFVPAEYSVQRAFFSRSALAMRVAELSSRPVWTSAVRGSGWTHTEPFRIACVMRFDEADERLCVAASAIAERCAGEVLHVYLTAAAPGVLRHEAVRLQCRACGAAVSPVLPNGRPDDTVISAVMQHHCRLIVAGRAMFVAPREGSQDLLRTAARLPGPLLSIPISLVAADSSASPARSSAARM